MSDSEVRALIREWAEADEAYRNAMRTEGYKHAIGTYGPRLDRAKEALRGIIQTPTTTSPKENQHE